MVLHTYYIYIVVESRYVQCARKCMRCHWLRIYWTPTKYLGKQIARLQMMVTMQPVLRFRRKLSSMYSGAHISWHELCLAENQGSHQNFVPPMLTYKFWLIFMGSKKILLKKISKCPTQKTEFSTTPVLNICLRKF